MDRRVEVVRPAVPRGRRRGQRRQRTQRAGQGSQGRGRRRAAEVDVDALASAVLEEVVVRLGLEGIVARDLVLEVVRDIVSGIVESRSTKPSVESIVKRVAANADAFMKALASILLRDPDSLTREQLEFIVSNAPELAGRAAPVLYRRAVELGLEGVAAELRSLWLRYGRPTPVRCPRCGFNAVTPALTCVVCGAELGEGEVKEAVGFRRMLEAFALRADPGLVLEAARAGVVLLDDGIHPPSMRPYLPFYVELRLSREERRLLEEAARSRSAGPSPRA